MLSPATTTAVLFTLVGFAAAQQQLFLHTKESAGRFEVYPTATPAKKSLYDPATQSPAMFDFESAATGKYGDVQFQCQYMAGLNFYDL